VTWVETEEEYGEMSTASCQKLFDLGTKIIGVGRNYAAHAKELGNAVPKVTNTLFFQIHSIHSFRKFHNLIRHQFSGTSVVSETNIFLLEKWRNNWNPTQREFSPSRSRTRGRHRQESSWCFWILCHGLRCWYNSFLSIFKFD